jgi:hypothetical protein
LSATCLGSLRHISVRELWTAARSSAIELVTAAGDVVAMSREDDSERFAGAAIGLGCLCCLGIVTHAPGDDQVRENVHEELGLERTAVLGAIRVHPEGASLLERCRG